MNTEMNGFSECDRGYDREQGCNECERGHNQGCSSGCGCDPARPSCLDDIACSQSVVAECESRLFCEITKRLGCEIKHARCIRELEHLLRLTNNFLAASAVKERAIGEVVSALGDARPE